MKALRFAFMTLIRDWKSGELAVMAFALLVAVTSLSPATHIALQVRAVDCPGDEERNRLVGEHGDRVSPSPTGG